ncbi:uncharacterized protein LOC128552688 [Mercenaria mercenaria]|uniref:uncharacterized protein LOC128552688 n=1 Tax=Mercenaria mercenaria TaxID=6596 RepID=UPI00234E9177|nr:uncharacterized protein LOC128552688 [Mercenaria mercenaria]
MQDQSCIYRRQHLVRFRSIQTLREAKRRFQEYKMLIIKGPRECGKTALAMEMLSSYEEGHWLIITKPEDVRHIRLGITCVIVIEDLGGKYCLDSSLMNKWLAELELLYSAVREGKLNIIITCDIPQFKAMTRAAHNHPMLGSTVSLSPLTLIQVKEERNQGHALSLPSSFSEADTYNTRMTKKWKFIKEINVKSDNEERCFITSMCMVPPNQLAMTDQNDKSLKLVNISDERIIDRVTFFAEPNNPTLLPQDRLAVLLPGIIQLFSIHIGFNKGNAIKLNGICNSIMFGNDVLFAFFHSPAVVKTLNMQGEELSTITLESDIQDMNIAPVYIALCPENSSFYISDWRKNLLLRVNMEGHMMAMYKDNGLDKPQRILAMSDGSVYVCNTNNDTVLQMRADFTRSRVVLGPSDNVTAPAAICYWPEENIMFVSSASVNPMLRAKLKMFTLI